MTHRFVLSAAAVAALSLAALGPAAAQPQPTPKAPPGVAYDQPTPFRTDTIDIPIAAEDALEYKLVMKKGQAIVYSWTVEAPPEEFYSDFHGHTEDESVVMGYKDGVFIEAHGSMTAEFDGVHGWFLQNQSVNPVVVVLKVAGFYELEEE